MNMNQLVGQWFGTSHSNDFGLDKFIMINVEARSPNRALMTAINPSNQQRELADASIEIRDNRLFGTTSNFRIYAPESHTVVPLPIYYRNAGIKDEPPKKSDFTGAVDGEKIVGSYKNDANQTGTFEVTRSFSKTIHGASATGTENITPMKWSDFKKHIAQFKTKGRVLFRGQHSNAYPLKTSFHRKNRNDVQRYMQTDVFRLRHQINAISPHIYQQNQEDLQGLLSFAQHHGFPTPLLDWTESPYVAAFFAFDCLTEKEQWYAKENRSPVRIFTFNLDEWQKVPRTLAQSLNDPCPDFQFFHPPAYNNPRYYPQQAMAAFSTVENIEDFIAAYEMEKRTKFLTKIDIFSDEREIVEEELRFMGITPATLFPGFEGACKSLRAELFDAFRT